VFLKCALAEVQSDGMAVKQKKTDSGKVKIQTERCHGSCKVKTKKKFSDKNKTEAASATADEASMDYNRYCFYHCRPYDFSVGNICVDLPSDVKSVSKGDADAAMHPHVTDPESQAAWGVASGKVAAPTEAPTTTTSQLPCEKSDPCAYKLMEKEIVKAKSYYRQAAEHARLATSEAHLAR